ncbi:hypothetical protein SARC_04503 [Sphaeroforma arctica JP610]|uniref:Uncharacterized protein n=1 Tax=Sphaeroforma arctica JP610 TaxID=667725 RepID=A0A0L0G285_9EUKA|nr:hypothetical protein SARC_04503 [Sphaeroforma arctica JP610]KNC83247.1 hypothetical protein SARC_04503 [Sphaeroforma arctica JP610]|eukprot:XP_014157149.1 hypothetical protein SARC_04503 [Sphaeroforma arctica JP610]
MSPKRAHSIKSLSLYDLHRILPHPVLTEQLADFIQHVRRYGVVEVNAIGAVLQDFKRIGEYLAAHASSEQFDGLLTEVEFWHYPDADVKYADFAALLQEIKTFNLTARGKSMPLGAYLGYLDDSTGASAIEKATTISALTDSIYLHCYGQQGYQTFGVCQERLQLFADTQASVKIIPIFSAEGGEYHAAYPFQGDFFRATGIDSGEALFREAFTADTHVANSNLQLASFQYYEYRYLGRYLPTTESHTSLGCSVRKAAKVL